MEMCPKPTCPTLVVVAISLLCGLGSGCSEEQPAPAELAVTVAPLDLQRAWGATWRLQIETPAVDGG